MEMTFIQILPLVLAASMSPTGLLFVMMILAGDSGVRHGTRFLAGATVTLVILGLLVVLAWNKGASEAGSHHALASGIADILLGVAVIALLAKAIFMKKASSSIHAHPSRRPYLILGALYMATNFSTLIPFIAAGRIIAEDNLEHGGEIVLLVPLILITMAMITFPVLLTRIAPHGSQVVLDPLNRFMSRYGARITEVIFLVIAIYLVLHGVVTIKLA